MSALPAARLYTPELLGLAVSLGDYPLIGGMNRHAEARSRTCGSTISMGIDCDDAGRIRKLGMMVSACAVGQAAAAIFAAGAIGSDAADIDAAASNIEQWLAGTGTQPEWAGIAVLEAAREYPARHGVIALPWKAASAALCNIGPQS